ncbi:MAG: arsenate reductase (glutaredoxin) [Epsilonproteobacteria bacterium]|nr:MAG: arsenate reductase (glutaredoxin) [Campylobacterota bacterium]
MNNTKISIWHNPRCSKSRNALKLLEDKNIEIDVVRYLESTPTEQEIKDVLKLLNISPRELMRTKEEVYKELGLKEVEDETKLIQAMVENPRLIERPIVIKDNKAAIGRPIEKIIALLDEDLK